MPPTSRKPSSPARKSSPKTVSKVAPDAAPGVLPDTYAGVRDDLISAIRDAQVQAVVQVNLLRNISYWMIGKALLDLQGETHADAYGKKVLEQMSRDLTTAFPGSKGYSPTNLKYMRMMASVVTSSKIGPQLRTDLSQHPAMRLGWDHIRRLCDAFLKDPEAFNWYASKALENGWSRNILLNQIGSHAYERSGKAISNVAIVAPDYASELMGEMGKDPLNFDFLTLPEKFKERDLENALVERLQSLMMELGRGFQWAGRQQRFVLVDEDNGEEKEFFTDLLFYHYPSSRFLVIDLKIVDFQYGDAMQVALYTRLIDEQLKKPSDQPTVGMVLCSKRHRRLATEALSVLNTPTFVTTYSLGVEVPMASLPSEFREALPDETDVERALTDIFDEDGEE